jgi:hypothetical protein
MWNVLQVREQEVKLCPRSAFPSLGLSLLNYKWWWGGGVVGRLDEIQMGISRSSAGGAEGRFHAQVGGGRGLGLQSGEEGCPPPLPPPTAHLAASPHPVLPMSNHQRTRLAGSGVTGGPEDVSPLCFRTPEMPKTALSWGSGPMGSFGDGPGDHHDSQCPGPFWGLWSCEDSWL